MVVAGEVIFTFTFETSFVEVGDVRLALIPFVVGVTYDLCLRLLTDEVIVIGGDTVSVVDNSGHAASLRVVDIVDIYSGSKNCPNVCTFWKDWHGVKELHKLKI